MLKYNQKQLAFIILRRDFLMKRNVYRILGCFLFAFTLCIMTPSFVKASVKNIPQTKLLELMLVMLTSLETKMLIL